MYSRRSLLKALPLPPSGADSTPVANTESRSEAGLNLTHLEPPTWIGEGFVMAWAASPDISDIRVRNETRPRMAWQAPGELGEGPTGMRSNEAAALHLKELGINVALMPFEAGWGLKADADAIEETREFVAAAHRHGIKVVGYVGGTMMTETLYSEEPEAHTWEMVDERGRPIYYWVQTFRRAPCRNNPGYQNYLRKILRFGIEEVKLDGFSYDQLEWWREPWSCHCKYCQTGFQAYLRQKYTDSQLEARLGFANLEGIRVPDFNVGAPKAIFPPEPVPWPPPLKDPLMQEWARFRCASLAEFWGKTLAYVRKLNPQVALIGNPTFYVNLNYGFMLGIDLQQLLPFCDVVWSEEWNEPFLTPDDCLVSRIRTYKMTRAMGRSVIPWQHVATTRGRAFAASVYIPPFPEDKLALCVAESLAYGDANLGAWDTDDGVEPPPRVRQYHDFFYSHIQDLAHTSEVSDVAILRSFASIEFNPARSNVSTILFEQVLIQCKFPFVTIYDVHLKDLSRYKVLVLANQDALSDEQVEQIRRFVEGGGGLVATEETSMLTDWRRRRDKFGLAALFGIDAPPGNMEAVNSVRRSFGKGRVVYLPRVEPAVEPPPPTISYDFQHDYWKLPKNYAEMREAVRWAGRDEFSATVDAPLWVTIQLAKQRRSHTWLLHLLNFRIDEPLRLIPVQIRIPDGMRLREAVLESPDGLPRQALEVTGREGRVSFTVPELRTYDLIFLRMEKKGDPEQAP